MRKDIMDKFYSAVKRYRIVLIVAAAVVLLLGIGGVSAKYITQKQDEDLLRAKNFYFTSNMLGESNPTYVLNSSATSMPFTLGNNIDELRCAEDNIAYTITISGGGTLSHDLTGTLEGGKVSVETFTLSGLEKGKTYTITAVGKAGYEKTLKATITVSADEKNVYKHLADHGAYYLLTVWTDNINGTMSIQYPDGLVPDNTDSAMAGIVLVLDGEDYKGTIFEDNSNYALTYSSHQYRFFKDDVGVLTENNFDVALKDDGGTIYPAAPATP